MEQRQRVGLVVVGRDRNPNDGTTAITSSLLALPFPVACRLMVPTGTPA